MSERIGYNDGIAGFVGFMRKLPFVKYREPDKRPSTMSQWYWLEKIERTLRILKDDHDASVPVTPPTPTPTPEPPPKPVPLGLAPQAYNQGSRGQNARFNVRINCTKVGERWVDGGGFRYDDGGLCDGGRSENPVPGLKPADEMDSREPWDPYVGPDGNIHPPYPPESFLI